MEFADGLNGLEKAVVQILSLGVVKDATLKDYVMRLRVDFPDVDDNSADLNQMLRRINAAIQPFSLNVRTVVIDLPSWHADANAAVDDSDNDGGERRRHQNGQTIKQYYHGISNMEEDFVAKDFGSNFKPPEIELFKKILNHLINYRLMSIHEVNELNTVKTFTQTDVRSTLQKLETAGWLSRDRNNKGYLEIGIRSYLELQSYFEAIILAAVESQITAKEAARESSDDNDDNDDKAQAMIQAARAELPQIIIY